MLRSLVRLALAHSKTLPNTEGVAIAGVKNILIADATSISLNNALAPIFPSTGSGGKMAGIKLHGLFNVTTGELPYLNLTEASRSDHTTKDDHFTISNPGDLLIRDLGYFEAPDLDRLHREKRFFITRVSMTVTQFLDAADQQINVWDRLISYKGFNLELNLKVGGGKFLHRFIAMRLPRKKWMKRLDDLSKEKGRALTKLEKTQAKWNLMITNLTVEQASRETIQHLYEMRWQIELLWKSLKSSLGIDRLRAATCENVVRAFIWAKLLNTVLLLNVRGLVTYHDHQEIGLIKWFRCVSASFAKIREMLRQKQWLALARLFRELAQQCFNQKHSKPSTKEKLNESIDLHNKPTRGSNP